LARRQGAENAGDDQRVAARSASPGLSSSSQGYLQKAEKPPAMAAFSFSTPKFRIAGPDEKTANFLWVVWRVSGLECGVVTLDFRLGLEEFSTFGGKAGYRVQGAALGGLAVVDPGRREGERRRT
jgi:hypothetical protein